MSDRIAAEDSIPFDLLVEENEAGILYLENDIIVYSNKTFASIIGEKQQLIKGKSILKFIHKNDKERLKKEIERLVSGKKNKISSDFLITHPQNSDLYISLHLNVSERKNGNTKIIGASRNSTKRVSNLAKLNQTESLLDVLYDNILSGIMIYNYNTETIVGFNPTALKIFGYDKSSELLKKNRLDIIPQFSKYYPNIDLHELTEQHGELIRKGKAFNASGVIIGKDNKEIMIKVNLVPTERAEGEAFIIFNDITKNFFANQKHRETEKKYKDIIDNVLEGIVYLDAKSGMPIFCNDEILDLFGVKDLKEFGSQRPNEFIDEKEINGLSPDDYYAQKILEALKEGKSETEFWLRKKTGERIRVSGVVTRNSKSKEKPTVICFFKDITKLHDAKIKLNQKNIELKKYIDSNLQLENFAYFASHDLQTPLRSIISFTQLLNKKLSNKITDIEQEYMDFIISSSMNMKNLVTDILSYSKADSEKVILSEVDINQMLFELKSEFQNEGNEKQIDFIIQEMPSKILVDRTKIRQVFSNLISNAIKFTKKKINPEISIGIKDSKSHWLFSVKDNGIGIEKQFQEIIFLLFKSLHPRSEYTGTGIGLALVKKIVEQHQGKIWVDSELNKGTTFHFTIQKFNQITDKKE